MNTLNPLETHLRSWTLRPPSPSLERRLFRPVQSRTFTPRLSAQGWLSPVAACVVLGGLLLALRGTPTPLADRSHAAWLATILSNQGHAAYLPGSFQRNQNRWDTFEWTNTGSFQSSGGPFLKTKPIAETPHGQQD